MESSVSFNTTTELGSLQDQNTLELHDHLVISRRPYELVQKQNAGSECIVVCNPRVWKTSYLAGPLHLDRNSNYLWTYFYHPPHHAARVWQSLQKCGVLGQYTDLPLPFTLLVPFVLLYIPPFDRSHEYELLRAKQRLDTPSSEPIPSWIQEDIDHLQRLSLPM